VAKVRLGRNQSISVDGITLLGTRDFDLNQELDGVDVTPWTASGTAELPLCESATLTVQVFHLEAVQALAAKWNTFPPQPVTVAIDSVGTGKFLVKSVKSAVPFSRLVEYTAVLRSWPYE